VTLPCVGLAWAGGKRKGEGTYELEGDARVVGDGNVGLEVVAVGVGLEADPGGLDNGAVEVVQAWVAMLVRRFRGGC